MKTILVVILFLPFFSNAQIISTVAGTDTAGYSGDGGFAVKARLNYPGTVAFDKKGNLYFSDENNNVVRKINSSGIITAFAGNGFGAGIIGSGGYSGDGGPASVAELYNPMGIAFDQKGNLYIADGGNNVIRKVDTLGIISTIAGNDTAGYSGDGGPATKAKLNTPYGITVDNSGNIYFSMGVVVRKINTLGIISTIAGGGANLAGNIPATDAKLVYPGCITIGPSSELYIPDWTHHRICKVNALGILTVVAGNGSLGNNGDGGLAVDAEFNAPNSVTFDKDGNMYISDNFADVVRKVNTAGIISTVAGCGIQGYSGDGGPATSAELNDPNGALMGPDGNLYFAEPNNNVIRKVTYNSAVDNVNSNRDYSIYPNPAKTQLTITATTPITSLIITNTLGQLILDQKCDKLKNMQIDISSFPSGIYFIKINTAYEQKIIKQ